jgi:hypothetical protein
MREPLKWYDASAADNPPWITALNEVRHLATREGWRHQHVQAIIVAIDQYAVAGLGNREFFLNKPYSIGGRYSLEPEILAGEDCGRSDVLRCVAACRSDDGVAAGEPAECFNPSAAVMRAEALSRREGHVGAIAFSRTGDPATGDFSDAKVIRKLGDVPNDLSALS